MTHLRNLGLEATIAPIVAILAKLFCARDRPVRMARTVACADQLSSRKPCPFSSISARQDYNGSQSWGGLSNCRK
jgi:hypothetical protein